MQEDAGRCGHSHLQERFLLIAAELNWANRNGPAAAVTLRLCS